MAVLGSFLSDAFCVSVIAKAHKKFENIAPQSATLCFAETEGTYADPHPSITAQWSLVCNGARYQGAVSFNPVLSRSDFEKKMIDIAEDLGNQCAAVMVRNGGTER